MSDGDDDRSKPGFQVFSAPSDAPRVRWQTDLISACVTAGLLLFLILVAGEQASFDRTTLEFVGELPDWLIWIGQAAYVVGVLYALGLLIGVAFFARKRLELLVDMLLAAALAVVIAVLLTRFHRRPLAGARISRPRQDERDVSGILRHYGGRHPGRGVADPVGAEAQGRLVGHFSGDVRNRLQRGQRGQ